MTEDANVMAPQMNTSMAPPFHQIGSFKFQELCADLLGEDPRYLNPQVYGRSGQVQRGIDIQAPLRNGPGIDVGQCKAWAKPSAQEIQKATEEFLPHLSYWREQGLKKFVLFIGCAVDD